MAMPITRIASFLWLKNRSLRVFFFTDTATTAFYTLSLHDALPISAGRGRLRLCARLPADLRIDRRRPRGDRKSTRLNSSHVEISYAVFCLKKKKFPGKGQQHQ